MRTPTLPSRAVRGTRQLLAFTGSAGIVLPEAIAEASTIQLQTVVSEATAALQALGALADPKPEDVEEGTRLFSVITDGKAELGRRGEEAGTRRNALGDLVAGLETPAAAETPAAEVPAVETAAVETPAAAAVETPAETITAAAAPRAGAVRNAGGGAAPEGNSSRLRFRAAPDVPNVATGHRFDNFADAAESILERTSSYPVGPAEGVGRIRNGALKLSRDFDPSLIASGYDADEVIERAASLERVGATDASLLASGGWGSASQTLYELVELEGTDGMLDVPEIQIVRGGVRYTRGPAFSEFRKRGFRQTEVQAIAGTSKPFYHIGAPDFVEQRAGVTGLAVTGGILQNKAYPESVARALRGLMVAHAHEVNGDTIKDIVTGSTAVAGLSGAGAFLPLLSSMELQAVDTRLKHGIVSATLLEAFAPEWVLSVLRQDLASRYGWNADRVPDSAIVAHFADAGVRIQFVKDWQDATDTTGGLGDATPATAWPTTVKFVMYPAGTWVRGLGDVISIDTLYDSAGLGTNDYVAMFSEESYLVTMRGHESRVVTVAIKADGSLPGVVNQHTVA